MFDSLRSSLQFRVLVTALVVFVLGTALLTFSSVRTVRLQMTELLSYQQYSAATLKADLIDAYFRQDIAFLTRLGAMVAPRAELLPYDQIQTILDERIFLHERFNGGIVILDGRGVAVADSPVMPNRVGIDFSDRDYLKKVFAEKAPVISSPVIGRASNAPIIVVNVPVLDNEEVVAVVLGTIRLSGPTFLDEIAVHTYGKGGSYLVIDPASGLIIAATDRSRVMRPAPPAGVNPMHDRYMAGFEGSGIAVNSMGIEELSSARRIPSTGWFAVATLPTAEAFAPISRITASILFSAAGLAFTVGIVIWLWMKRQLSPLRSCARELAAMTSGEIPAAPLPVTRTDEIGQLIESFNRLLGRLQEREDLFREIAESGIDMIFRIDTEGRFTWASPASAGVLGAPPEDIAGCTFLAQVHPADRDKARMALSELLRGESVRSLELDFTRRDGSLFQGEMSATPIVKDGCTTRVQGVIRDVSERKTHRRERERLIEQLREANAELRTFSEISAHHLQEPTRRLISYAHLLGTRMEGTIADDEVRLALRYIVEGAERLRALLRDIQHYLCAHEPRGEIVLADTDAIVRELVGKFPKQMAQARAQIRIGALPPARIDTPRLKEIFAILIRNALQYRRPETPLQIDIEAERFEAGVRYTVSDNGIGIPAAYRQRVLGVFERLHPGGELSGTGIGLAIVRRIVESRGGRIWIEESHSGGACINFEMMDGDKDERKQTL